MESDCAPLGTTRTGDVSMSVRAIGELILWCAVSVVVPSLPEVRMIDGTPGDCVAASYTSRRP